MSVYTTQEKVQMVTWSLSGNSLRRTAELFSVFFENRPIPSKHTISRILKQFKETGCVNNTCQRKPLLVDDVEIDDEIDVLAAFEANPNLSVRQVARECGKSHMHIHRILRKHKYFPYKYSTQQELVAGDSDKRITFCESMLEKCNDDDTVLENICFSDECTFTLNGEPNRQNYRYWSRENQHVKVQSHTQYRQSVNVWMGILGNNLIGPFYIEGTLDQENYLNLLQNQIVPNIIAVTANINSVFYQQDGAPAHYSRIVREYLDATFPNRWIGRGGPIAWPPRSPDLSPNDFFLWGHLKSVIYTAERFPDLQSLKDAITGACFNITPEMLSNVRRHFYERLSHCLIVNGETFEHLIR